MVIIQIPIDRSMPIILVPRDELTSLKNFNSHVYLNLTIYPYVSKITPITTEIILGDKVGKALDETIYKSDVIKISSLNGSNTDIHDLTGLEYLTNLKTLDLGNNSLTKITSLSKLTLLRTLK